MNKIHNNNFPFSAVQGQPLFKLALLLTTVNPLIGGVLISGPRGCAKSTLARAVADLLPTQQNIEAPFVTLPLGASEEMLIGTLDLDKILNNKSVQFSPGLLKKAHGGVLYVDEVNLLPDHLVDQLLDVASSGINIIERDGISHQHDAVFTLIGTMNPDEGELRPQLQDRFGLMVELDNIFSIEERINIIKARQAFEEDKRLFCDRYEVQQIVLQQQIDDARKLLPNVSCDNNSYIEIATRCQQANVEGLRADIMMHRASLTHAAWCGRTVVTTEDIEAVAPLVLLHRSGAMSNQSSNNTHANENSSKETSETPSHQDSDQGSQQSNKNNGGFSRPQAPAQQPQVKQPNSDISNQNPVNLNNSDDDNNNDVNIGEWGAMPKQNAQSQKTGDAIDLSLPSFINHLPKKSKSVENTSKNRQGQKQQLSLNGSQKSHTNSQKPDWFATLTTSLGEWPPANVVYKKLAKGQQNLHLILLDTSASTLTNSLSSVAKSVVMNIAQSAYLDRDKMSVIGFGNDSIETIIEVGRSPKNIENQLDSLCASGGTPLRLALQTAAQRIKSLNKQYPELQLFCYLITDGRTRVDLDDLKLTIPTLLIDIESATVKRGRGKQLATQLDANYISLHGGER